MITDTAYFRYPHYHKPTDTPDKIDTEKLARIVYGVERVIRHMARPDWPTAVAQSKPLRARNRARRPAISELPSYSAAVAIGMRGQDGLGTGCHHF